MQFLNNLYENIKLFFRVLFGGEAFFVDLDRYGFSEPANSQMGAIIEMYYSTSQTMFYILLFIIIIIWAIIGSRNEDIKYPIAFKRWQETLIDIGVLFIPLIIIYYLTVPAIGYILHVDRFLQWNEAIFTIEVIGHQWYRSYYLDSLQNFALLELYYIYHTNFNEIEYFFTTLNDEYQFDFDQIMDTEASIDLKYLLTNKILVLPVLHYIKVLITSEDVIHSWALPQLGIKVDAIPGRIQMFLINSNYCGSFYGQRSELCGVNHAFMPINVEFVLDYQFIDWYFKNIEIRPYKIILDNNLKTILNV
jgi:heme/copper-type cytochrome/quinol oxidase subunit 2